MWTAKIKCSERAESVCRVLLGLLGGERVGGSTDDCATHRSRALMGGGTVSGVEGTGSDASTDDEGRQAIADAPQICASC